MICTTFVYELMPNGLKREMTKIHATSLFFGFKIPTNIAKTQETPESQSWIARYFKHGWVTNGGMDPMKIVIEQVISDHGHKERVMVL